MGLGIKRTCLGCSAKFYDLEKSPIICPKCNKKFNLEDFTKVRRPRKKAVEEELPEDEVELGDTIELLDDEAEELEDDVIVVEQIGLDDDENSIEDIEEDSDRLLVELEEENDDIIESDDGREA